MGHIKITLTVYDNRWDTVAKESTIVSVKKDKLIEQDFKAIKKVVSGTGNLMIEMMRKVIDEKNQATQENDLGRSEGRSKDKESKEGKS